MKKLFVLFLLCYLISSCTKSETQYIDQDNKRATVNDRKSDTINTLPEISDTLRTGKDSANVQTDNE